QYHMVGEPAYSFWVYEQVYDASGNPVEGQYVDQNADGKIDDSDKIIFHSPEPKWTMSWNNNFNYKGFDLGFTLRANFGNYVYNNHKYERTRPVNNLYGYQLNNLLNDSYLFTSVAPSPLSSYYVENASFLRCDNITLGYTWDNILYDGFRLRLYGAVQNPFVITKYKGLDPEVFSGIDNNCYPNPTTWTVGVVATF
ncbi:MAG: SusC/RagA family protein, partial [Muribaculaceae bacterium]|nr:SusC/RagA family protein [Muribaculaceae bacterium]